jgi:hypothetical protein
VVDADGNPVAGAVVLSAGSPQEMSSEVNRFAVSTDAAGRFRTGQVKAGEWFLIARAKGHAPADQPIKVGTAVPQVEITLGRPRPFAGRVVDPQGKPVAGAFVNVDTWRRYRCLGVFLWSDSDGRFRWDDASDDEMTVNVSLQGYVGVFMRSLTRASEDVVFTLEPCLSVQGTVRDAETKKRVENAILDFGAVDPKTGEVPQWSSPPQLGFATGVMLGGLNVNLPVLADAYKIRIQSPGYQTFVSRTFRREEKVVFGYEIMLVPGNPTGPAATVVRPDGKPLAGARVFSAHLKGGGLSLNDGVVDSRSTGGRDQLTGPDGTFALPRFNEPWVVLVLGEDAYALASKDVLEKSSRVQAKPYARVEGRYVIGARAVANQELELSGHIQDRSTMYCTVFLHQKATTDIDGRFRFKNVIPTNNSHVAHRGQHDGPGPHWSLGEPVRVEPGATVQITIGGKGRPVIGRVEPPDGWTKSVDFTDDSETYIETNRAFTPYPPELFRGKTTLNGGYWSDWTQRWLESPEGREYRDRRFAVRVGLEPDGSFRVDDVPPGEYRLAIRVKGEITTQTISARGRDPGPFARIVRIFTVPAVPGGRSDEALDLGVMRLTPRVTLKPGDPAPVFEIMTIEGKKLTVPRDFQGKVLLLDFGTLWDMQSALQIARLNEINQKYGKDPRFAILSVMFSADIAETRKYIEDKGQPWPQSIAGPLSNPISVAYAIDDENVPSVVLIGPDGKVLLSDRYAQMGEAIGKALGQVAK